MEGETETIIESTKIGRKEEGREEGRVEDKESGITVEDCGGHSAKASAKLMSSLCLHGFGSLKATDFGFFWLLFFLCFLEWCLL